MVTSVVVANHNRDLSILKKSLPIGVEFIEVNLGFERSKQRNIGIEKATGDVILWLDSDQSISPLLVDECEALISKGYSCVYIPEVLVVKSFFGKIRKFEREFYTGTAIDVPRAVARYACPRFDEELNGPEDACFGQRIKGKRAISKNVLYHHDDISFFDYIIKKNYYGKSMKKYKEKYPYDKCLDWKYRAFWVFLEKNKYKKLLLHPVLFLGILFLIGIRSIIYIKNIYWDK